MERSTSERNTSEQIKPDSFETNNELRDYVVNKIKKLGLTESLKRSSPESYFFFEQLFQRHPTKQEKQVDQMCDISIRRFAKSNPKAPLAVSDHQFFIQKHDGTEDSISWTSCINGKLKQDRKRLTWAMRHAIEPQIRLFRTNKSDQQCMICETKDQLTVDHQIKFRHLMNDFVRTNPDFPNVFGKNELKQEIFRDEDQDYSKRWQTYHYKNARLRILCRDCNQKLDPI